MLLQNVSDTYIFNTVTSLLIWHVSESCILFVQCYSYYNKFHDSETCISRIILSWSSIIDSCILPSSLNNHDGDNDFYGDDDANDDDDNSNHWLVHSTQLPEQSQSLQNASSTSDNDNEDVGNIENGDENADILCKCTERSVHCVHESFSLFDKGENF